MSDTYREEQELNEVESSLKVPQVHQNEEGYIVANEDLEDEPEDVNEEEESDYQDDEMIYN